MVQWIEKLYIGKSITPANKKRIVDRINRGKIMPGIYLLTYPSCENNIIDIFPALLLKQRAYRDRCPKIIGIAKSKDDAFDLMEEILMEVYGITGNFHVKEYLENR